MLVDFLTTHFRRDIDEGWGAFETGNLHKAESHFQAVLAAHNDPRMTVYDAAEAHAGMGAVSFAHNDLFEASRWYAEGHHILDTFYDHSLPTKLHWHNFHDRPFMRILIGLGHVAYHKGDHKKAEGFYTTLLVADSTDELGVQDYLAALKEKKPFPEL